MTSRMLPTIEVGLATTSIVVVSASIQQRISMAAVRRIKILLSKFKDRGDPDVIEKKFNYTCYANQEKNQKLALFPMYLKK
jgi:hypothetical protein